MTMFGTRKSNQADAPFVNRFCMSRFIKEIKEETKIGGVLHPKSLYRSAVAAGAKGTREQIEQALVFALNKNQRGWARKRSQSGGYEYVKLDTHYPAEVE